MSTADRVKVFARLRPRLEKEGGKDGIGRKDVYRLTGNKVEVEKPWRDYFSAEVGSRGNATRMNLLRKEQEPKKILCVVEE